MNLFNLVATLVLNAQAYKQGLNDASKDASSFSSKAGVAFKAVSKAVLAIIGAVTAVSAAMKKLVTGTIDYGDEVDKQSQKMNLSADAYQKWSLAAQMAGSSAETLQTGIRQLTKFTQELAAGTGDSLLTLQQLGLGYEEFMAMNPDEQLMAVVEAMQGLGDGTQKTEAAQKLFGQRAYQELMPLLNQEKGSLDELFQSYENMGLIMDDISVKKSAELNDKFTLLQATVKGLTNEFVTGMYPQLTNVVDIVQDLLTGTGNVDENLKKLTDNVVSMVDKFLTKLPQLLNVGVDVIFMVLDGMVTAIGNPDFVQGLFDLIHNILLKVVELIPYVLKSLTTFIPAVLKGLMTFDWGSILAEIIKVILVDLPTAVTELAFNLINMLVDVISDPMKMVKQLGKIGIAIGQGIINGMIGVIESAINGIVKLLDNVDFLNIIPDDFKVVIPKLNFLADGGVMDKLGSLYVAGEKGAEIVAQGSQGTGVANVKQIEQAMYNALADIAPVLVNGIVGGLSIRDDNYNLPQQIVVKIGEKEFNSYVVRAVNDNLNQKGRQSLNKITRY